MESYFVHCACLGEKTEVEGDAVRRTRECLRGGTQVFLSLSVASQRLRKGPSHEKDAEHEITLQRNSTKQIDPTPPTPSFHQLLPLLEIWNRVHAADPAQPLPKPTKLGILADSFRMEDGDRIDRHGDGERSGEGNVGVERAEDGFQLGCRDGWEIAGVAEGGGKSLVYRNVASVRDPKDWEEEDALERKDESSEDLASPAPPLL